MTILLFLAGLVVGAGLTFTFFIRRLGGRLYEDLEVCTAQLTGMAARAQRTAEDFVTEAEDQIEANDTNPAQFLSSKARPSFGRCSCTNTPLASARNHCGERMNAHWPNASHLTITSRIWSLRKK